MPVPQERATLIATIGRLPDRLDAVARNLSEEELGTSYREGGWTRRQVIHHVADSHMNAYIRMRLVVTEDHPTLKPYDQDRWAELSDSGLPIDPSLRLIRGLHERWVAMLESLPEEAFERTAHHPEDGEVSLNSLLHSYARHGEHHVRQIEVG